MAVPRTNNPIPHHWSVTRGSEELPLVVLPFFPLLLQVDPHRLQVVRHALNGLVQLGAVFFDLSVQLGEVLLQRRETWSSQRLPRPRRSFAFALAVRLTFAVRVALPR